MKVRRNSQPSRKHQDLSIQLVSVEGELTGLVDSPRRPKQDMLLYILLYRQVKSVKILEPTKRYYKTNVSIGEVTKQSRVDQKVRGL
jgi:hypothetical protein